jgi:hypothetical protein
MWGIDMLGLKFNLLTTGAVLAIGLCSALTPAPTVAGPGKGSMPSFNDKPSNQGTLDWMTNGRSFPTFPDDTTNQTNGNNSTSSNTSDGFVRPKGLYAFLTPNHQDDTGRAQIIMMAPELVRANGDDASATFAPSSIKLGPFGGSLGLGLIAPKRGVYLIDITVFPLGPYPANNTINFNVTASSGTQQVLPVTAAAELQHLSLLITATGSGKYNYSFSTKDATWIFTSCSITKL